MQTNTHALTIRMVLYFTVAGLNVKAGVNALKYSILLNSKSAKRKL